MLLMDMVAQTAAMIGATDEPVLAGLVDMAHRLEGAPRFLFDDAATRTAVELNLGRPKVLREAMAHLRIPYTKLWVEWDDRARQKLRDKFDKPLEFAELRPNPLRIGFLLEADPAGRRGTATWAWSSPQSALHGGVPNIGAVQPYFDLDQRFFLPADRVEGLMGGNLAALWRDNPVQLEQLFDIWRTSEHRISPWGKDYLALSDELHRQLAYADVVGEYIMIWCSLMLLTASRPIIDLTPVDLGRLNKQRVKKGKVPLFDHTRVTLHLTRQAHDPVLRGPLGYSRKSPRVHLVASYLARRGNKHWVVSPYWRGKGEMISRHVQVVG